MARIGKIARLPRHLRTQLNERLADGEPATIILPWLNENEQAREILDLYFEGKPVTESNLSDWRQGGYEEWLRHQEARESARSFLAESEELEDELDGSCLADRVTEIAALALLHLLREAQAGEGPDRRKAVLDVVRELQRLRRGDHEMARVRIKEQRLQAEQDAAEEARDEVMRQNLAFQKNKVHVMGRMLWRAYRDDMAEGKMSPAHAAEIENLFAKSPDLRRACSVPDLPIMNAAPKPKKHPETGAKSG